MLVFAILTPSIISLLHLLHNALCYTLILFLYLFKAIISSTILSENSKYNKPVSI